MLEFNSGIVTTCLAMEVGCAETIINHGNQGKLRTYAGTLYGQINWLHSWHIYSTGR